MRAAPLTDAVKPVRPGMEAGRYRPLDEADILKVHRAALRLLAEVGLADAPQALHAELDRDSIGWTIFKADRKIVPLLDKEPGWRRLFTSDAVVVHVRESAVR